MAIMPTFRDTDRDRIILGPCPGCDLWTIEYRMSMIGPEGFAPWDLEAAIEAALYEHMLECSGLQEVVDTL